ncbi:MAG: hypothetical protein ACYTGH_12910, partial [Planctomycetota bacterium]
MAVLKWSKFVGVAVLAVAVIWGMAPMVTKATTGAMAGEEEVAAEEPAPAAEESAPAADAGAAG